MSVRLSGKKNGLVLFGFGVVLGAALGVPTGGLLFSGYHEKRLEQSSVRQMDDLFQPSFADMIKQIGRIPVENADYEFYVVSGAEPAWLPVNIKTDGKKTYIQFRDNAAVGWSDDGKPNSPNIVIGETTSGKIKTWSYAIIDDVMVVDAVIVKALLVGADGDTVAIQHNPNKQGENK